MATTVNLFKKAIEKQPEEKKKAGKIIVPVKLGDKLTQLSQVRDEMEVLKAKEALLSGDVRTFADEEFMKLYLKNKKRPESFIMQDETGGKILVIMQDKYTKLSESTEATIKEVYKDSVGEILEETTEYKLDAELVEKHGDKLSKAIMSIKGITDDEKERLIKGTSVTRVRKGIIEKLIDFKEPETLVSLVRPVIQLKNQK